MSTDIKKLKTKASKGSTACQIQLGHSYLTGVGYDGVSFPQDYSEARCWLEMAHEKGAYTATTLLGKMHEEGKGMPKSIPEAAELYEIAAERGSFLSCIFLARLYAMGSGGVVKSIDQAYDWYKKALSFEDEVDSAEKIAEARSYISNH